MPSAEPVALGHSFHADIGEIPAHEWNRLAGDWLGVYPFIGHDFLSLLEQTGCVGGQSGWQPVHLRLTRGDATVAVMPLYAKTHSWGEYVFDWQWADAWERATGSPYYPKLVTAIPMTPCVGPRLLVAPGLDPALAAAAALRAVQGLAENIGASGWHLLFPLASELAWWEGQQLSYRRGQQFQWFRRGADTFDDYLGAFTARQRKTIRRERRLVQSEGFAWRFLSGGEMDEGEREALWHFYQLTYLRRGRAGYLSRQYFERAPQVLGDRFRGLLCYRDGKPVAGAVLYAGQGAGQGAEAGGAPGCSTLYGRHWGCYEEYDQLHFEACYYRGIEACLERGWQRFDSGVQGEHKLRRGFIPVPTVSAHWIRDERLRRGVHDFCRAESRGVASYGRACAKFLPFNAEHLGFGSWDSLEPSARCWFAGGPSWE